ncbi:MAG: Holliday junction branch migration protein RuvA [Clostridia bacterium]|nr:Holliday junction branch migration protein RuvA [Clostridia bacterium]
MFAHLNGILTEMTADSIVIECGGVGYQLTVSGETLSGTPEIGEKMKVYTYMAVREDAVDLFGFATREEKRMFERLRSVSGVGPKSALQILSTLGTQGVSIALAAGDAAAIARAPGVGKKTAQRLILDLRDKVTEEELLPSSGARAGSGRKKGVEAEVIEALMALGCGASEAAEAVARVAGQSEDASELTRLALKGMGR